MIFYTDLKPGLLLEYSGVPYGISTIEHFLSLGFAQETSNLYGYWLFSLKRGRKEIWTFPKKEFEGALCWTVL